MNSGKFLFNPKNSTCVMSIILEKLSRTKVCVELFYNSANYTLTWSRFHNLSLHLILKTPDLLVEISITFIPLTKRSGLVKQIFLNT